jgi:tetraacyldisaccharide 4'-kinase
MWQALHGAWWRLATRTQPRSFSDALACGVLQAGSVAFQAAVAVRNAAYDRGWVRQVQLPCRVVSVGDLTVGGGGKTACVELVARKLLAVDKRVAVLSRGYGGPRQEYRLRWESDPAPPRPEGRGTPSAPAGAGRLVVTGIRPDRADGLADEPQLLAQRLAGVPILVGSRRDRTGLAACQELGADVALLDDGFQHRRLQRDCDIVVVNSRMPLDGWAVFPRGPMRERLTSLRRAHVIVLTKADEALDTLGALQERLRSFNRQASLVTASHEPVQVIEAGTGQARNPHALAGVRVGLLSSIGDPQGFEATVRRLQAAILWHRAYPDHHRYAPADWEALTAQAARTRPDAILTTEKDWVRLRPWLGVGTGGGGASTRTASLAAPLWVLQVRMKVLSGDDVLDARLARLWAR